MKKRHSKDLLDKGGDFIFNELYDGSFVIFEDVRNWEDICAVNILTRKNQNDDDNEYEDNLISIKIN